MVRKWLVALGIVLLPIGPVYSQQPRTRAPEKRMEAVQRLKLAKLQGGTLPTYYSTGSEVRARYFQSLIAGERDFYRQTLQVPLGDLQLAVLTPADWSPVNTHDPYGMPSVEGQPRVIAMPADWSKAVIIPVPDLGSLPPHLQAEVHATGKPLRDLIYVGADSIGTHELGHAIIEDYRIGWTTHWFNEFLASYVGNVYIEEKRPADRAADHIFWQTGLDYPHPHTSLDYFETHYDELSAKAPQNYGWYQCALDQRVLAVYRKEGVGFLKKVKAAFLPDGPQLTSAEVIDKLESIDPGWRKWAAEVEADRVEVVRE
jgi:hypothetical protein